MDADKKVYTDNQKMAHVAWSKINADNFQQYIKPKHNGFAVITGHQHIVVDYDAKHDPPRHIYDMLYTNCEAVEKTPGGYHFWYRIDSRTAHLKTKECAHWNNREIKGLDIRSKGGISYSAPSNYRADGITKKYVWERGTLATAREMPEEVLECLTYTPQEDMDDMRTFRTSTIGDVVDDITTVLNGLSAKRADNYDHWLGVGMALKNGGYPCEVWDEWSQRSSKYRAGVCDRKWRTFREGGAAAAARPITVRTLYSWLKEDNHTLFIDLISSQNSVENGLLMGTHAAIAEYFYSVNPESYVYSDVEGWYVLEENGTWKDTGSHEVLSIPNILNNIRTECSIVLAEILKKVVAKGDTYRQRLVADVVKKLGCSSFLKGSTAFLQGLYYKKGVEKLFNEQRDLYAFSNGVIDLKTMEFRPISPCDYITITCDFPYREIGDDEKQVVADFLEDVFPDEAVRKYMVAALSRTLEGHNKGEWFHALTGLGSNGKSRLMDLCAATFGGYYHTIGVSYLTKDDDGKERPLPDLVKARWARMLVASEPEEKDRLQVGFLKLITGGDEISCRGMYGKNVLKYTPQFKLWVMTNDMPRLSKYDQGIERRMRCVHFATRFVHEPVAANERARDDTLKGRIKGEEWRYGFIGLLLDAWKETRDVVLHMPEDVRRFTEEYMLENNPVGAWLRGYWENTGRREDIIQKTDFYNAFLTDTGIYKSQKVFSEDLKKCNVNEKRIDNIRYYLGFKRKEIIDNN